MEDCRLCFYSRTFKVPGLRAGDRNRIFVTGVDTRRLPDSPKREVKFGELKKHCTEPGKLWRSGTEFTKQRGCSGRRDYIGYRRHERDDKILGAPRGLRGPPPESTEQVAEVPVPERQKSTC